MKHFAYLGSQICMNYGHRSNIEHFTYAGFVGYENILNMIPLMLIKYLQLRIMLQIIIFYLLTFHRKIYFVLIIYFAIRSPFSDLGKLRDVLYKKLIEVTDANNFHVNKMIPFDISDIRVSRWKVIVRALCVLKL